ncbi:hypothetical protein NPX79_03665 [Spiroplasma endosymbiont of Anurida maritima]|uniref:hypothetical protein n=1 Tax=Spiroplasma endosymbiont of Anurida maritima TaxID=2967972 RepID=UPI0036D3A4C5
MIEEDTLLNIVKTKDNSLDKIKTNLKNIIFKKINKYITIDREKFSIENIEINYDNKKISKTPIVNEDLQKTNNQLITIKFKYKDYTFPYNQNLKMTVITKLKNNEKMIENKEIKIEKTPTQDIVLSTEIKQEEKAIVKIKDKIKEETPTQEIVVSTETKDKEETPLEKDIEKIEEITNKETLLKAQEEKTTEETIKLITPKTSV